MDRMGHLAFVGAGPGAPDLVTVRGAELLKAAEVVVYAGSLVDERLLELCPSARRVNSAKMALDEMVAQMAAEVRAGRRVVRLHTGDPSIYGAVAEQFRALDAAGIPYEVVPGVSSAFAAAAALKAELTVPGVSQSVVFTRIAGRTPMPAGESLAALAAHGSTLCIFLSVGEMDEVCAELRAAGRPESTPVAVVYRASWPNERIVRGTLADISGRVREAGVLRQAMIVVGEVLTRGGELSRLYDAHFATGYRHHAFHGRVALFALTRAAACKAAEVAAGLEECTLWVPAKHADAVASWRARTFSAGGFAAAVAEAWRTHEALVCVMACGIVVRTIAPLLRDKHRDPAVVVVDERGAAAVSLLSGHEGGGNALARDVARITGGRAVITTASDVEGRPAFDELARRRHCEMVNPEAHTELAAAVAAGESVEVWMPGRVFAEELAGYAGVARHEPRAAGEWAVRCGGVEVRLRQPRFTLGIGCRKGVSAARLREVVRRVLEAHGFALSEVAAIASAEAKRGEAGLAEFAAESGVPLVFHDAKTLNAQAVPHPSEAARRHLGLNSVSEAAALASAGAGARLYVEKQSDRDVTVALAGGQWP